MPSALVQRISTASPAVSNTNAAANSGGDHHLILIKHCSLPQTLIRELSLYAPSLLKPIPDTLQKYHDHRVGPAEVCSAVVRAVLAPVDTVWAVVRRFDNPLAYKHFLKSCQVIVGDGDVGTLREVRVVSGVPADFSVDRLDILDEEHHVIGFSVIGGEHRLRNYRSVTTLHEVAASTTVVVESYVVDVPDGNTLEETCVFADTIVRCNLQSLAQVVEKIIKKTNIS